MPEERKQKVSDSIRKKYATDEAYREKCRLAKQLRRERECSSVKGGPIK